MTINRSGHASSVDKKIMSSVASSTGMKPPGRKQRCWAFHVAGITREAAMGADNLLAAVRQKYSTIKTLAAYPPTTQDHRSDATTSRHLVVTVHFAGPQPSEGPGLLLCRLLRGRSVHAEPVELPRGRKKRGIVVPVTSEGGRSGEISARTTGPPERVYDHHISSHDIRAGDGEFNKEDQQVRTKTVDKDLGAPDKPTEEYSGSDSPGWTSVDEDERSSTRLRALLCVQHRQNTSAPLPQEKWGLGDDGLLQWKDHDDGLSQPLPHSGIIPVLNNSSLDTGAVFRSDSCSGDIADLSETISNTGSDGLWDVICDGGIWDNDNDQLVLEPSPIINRSPISGWSLDPIPIGDDDSGNEVNTVMDTLELGDFLSEANTVVGIAGDVDQWAEISHTPLPQVTTELGGVLVETQASVRISPLENLVEASSQQNRDFEGRIMPPSSGLDVAPQTNLDYVEFMGLERTGHDLRKFVVTARFALGALHMVHRPPSAIKVEPNGRTYAPLKYPSMRDMWPEVDPIINIRHVKVDVEVEIRSACGNFQYVAPKFEVAYVRIARTVDEDKGVSSLLLT